MGSSRTCRPVRPPSILHLPPILTPHNRGIYDREYLTYIRQLLSLLPKYGLTAFVSMHQDVWSRYSGGSGAPAWTLELAGFDLRAIEETGAAWLLGQRRGGRTEEERGVWPCGYQKLSAATMAWVVRSFLSGCCMRTYRFVGRCFGEETRLLQSFSLTMEEAAKCRFNGSCRRRS